MNAFLTLATSILVFTATANASIGTSHDYARVEDVLVKITKDFPQNATLFELAQNSQGRSIVGLKIGNGPIANLIVGTHHGNEPVATDVALGAAADLAAHPIEGRTVYVIPVLNISGFEANLRREAIDSDPKVTQDPNRDYPGPCATQGPFKLKSTHALAEFIDKENIVSSVTLHTPGPIVLYPWGLSTKDTSTVYDAEFIGLSKMCAIESGYKIGNSADSYSLADGTFEDYAFWKHGIWSILIELSHANDPGESEIASAVRTNVPGLRNFMTSAPSVRAEHHEFEGQCLTSFIGSKLE
jgi:carboxypeptidase T